MHYIYRTYYLHRAWTWIRRVAVTIILSFAVLSTQVDEDIAFAKWILIVAISVFFLVKPKDDIALDQTHFYYIQNSIFKPFTKITRFKLAEIHSLRSGGIHSDTWELVDIFNGSGNMGGHSNTVEIIFKDDRSKSIDLSINKKSLTYIVKQANILKDKV
jgi:hypothetical protein